MPNIGPAEIFVILIVALLVFGPDKLPEIGKQVGRAVREFRKVQATLREEVREVLEPREKSGSPSQPPQLPPIAEPTLHSEPDDAAGWSPGHAPAGGALQGEGADAATANAAIPSGPQSAPESASEPEPGPASTPASPEPGPRDPQPAPEPSPVEGESRPAEAPEPGASS